MCMLIRACRLINSIYTTFILTPNKDLMPLAHFNVKVICPFRSQELCHKKAYVNIVNNIYVWFNC